MMIIIKNNDDKYEVDIIKISFSFFINVNVFIIEFIIK